MLLQGIAAVLTFTLLHAGMYVLHLPIYTFLKCCWFRYLWGPKMLGSSKFRLNTTAATVRTGRNSEFYGTISSISSIAAQKSGD